ncbi:MAG: glycosyltransferase family 2 protein [Peptostreptococcaceae bacterium]
MIDNKKIVSVTMVKNECDIIELFVRHNLQVLDEMYIIDHLSTDNTVPILEKLKEEGLPIHILKYNSEAYPHGWLMTKVQEMIINENKADFIMFIDVDELIYSDSKEFISSLFDINEKNSYLIYELNYVLRECDENKNIPLHEKLLYRISQVGASKSILNVNFHENKPVQCAEGGHSIYKNTPGDIPLKHIATHLSHFPYRSREQFLSKIFQSALGYLITSYTFRNGLTCTHLIDPYKRLIESDGTDLAEFPLVVEKNIDTGAYAYEPLPFKGHLKYQDMAKVDALDNIINMGINYIKYHKDEENEKELLYFLNNTDRSDKIKALVEVGKNIEKYIIKKGSARLNTDDINFLEYY